MSVPLIFSTSLGSEGGLRTSPRTDTPDSVIRGTRASGLWEPCEPSGGELRGVLEEGDAPRSLDP